MRTLSVQLFVSSMNGKFLNYYSGNLQSKNYDGIHLTTHFLKLNTIYIILNFANLKLEMLSCLLKFAFMQERLDLMC